MTMLAPQSRYRQLARTLHQRNREWPISGGRSSADGVQTSAQAALQSARRLRNWFSSIFGHCAPHVDRPNRVQLVEEGGCRVTSNNEINPQDGGKRCPWSLSCNPDLTLDLLACRARLRPFDRLQHDAAPSRLALSTIAVVGELLLMAAGITNARRVALLDTDLMRYQLA